MNAEYQAMQYQNDIIKYKMQVREYENKEKDYRQKLYLSQDTSQKNMKELKNEHNQQMNELKNKLKAM